MKLFFLLVALLSIAVQPVAAQDLAVEQKPTLIVVQGAGGEQKYEEQFKNLTSQMVKLANANLFSVETIQSKKDQVACRDQLIDLLKSESTGKTPLWIVLFGHGTFDGNTAKFNLEGPDFSATELKTWLADFKRPIAIVNCASASAPFINALSGDDRVVIAATKSGFEMNATQFARFFVEALVDLSADIDRDEQVSLLEAFLSTSVRVLEFYESDGRLVSEHSLIDDNADSLGTPADWFQGVRVIKKAKSNAAVADGFRAHQWHMVQSSSEKALSFELRQHRDELELRIEKLRMAKPLLKPDEYYQTLEELMVELGEIYEKSDK